ncbi:hypothetical protein VDP83_05345, partial [Xanthomonas campestris pv. campestris]|nr:hypothetical protein [Xanthomonas campestris pv. campestris]
KPATTQYPSTPGFISNHWYGRWGQVIVARLCQIDDSACVEMPFYPADLVSDGRSPRYPDVPSSFELRLDQKKKSFSGLRGIFNFRKK